MNPEKDIQYIKLCFELAQKGAGKVSPNPLVGAVIVKDNKIISKGWHDHFGAPHAEAMAIEEAKENFKGATMYCNLEPCCHTHKKTPPCLPLIINSGITRIVLSNSDPNPQVAGESIKQMRMAGIEVVENILEQDGRELNRFFFKHIVEQKPWVSVKIAQTMDAKIGKTKEGRSWITGEESAKYVHGLRATFDAVLIGAGTVKLDNPHLNVRHVAGRDPLKVIIGGKLSLSPDAHIFEGGAVWIFHDKNMEDKKSALFAKPNVRLFGCDVNKNGQIELDTIIEILGKEGLTSLLIEGGQNMFSQFITKNMFDELIVLQAPVFFGKGISSVYFSNEIHLKFHSGGSLGDDYFLILRKNV